MYFLIKQSHSKIFKKKQSVSNESAILIHLKKKKSKLVNTLFIDAFTYPHEKTKRTDSISTTIEAR